MRENVEVLFKDRSAAGQFLAELLSKQLMPADPLVLALPRGGVPVAFPIAEQLQASLDIFIVRKLGVPGYEELAMGAIATGGVRVLNHELVQRLGISMSAVEAVAREEADELQRREALYRNGRPAPALTGKDIILVDDGLATGASMRAAVQALRSREPASITVAVPVASAETCEQFRHQVDEIVCGKTPEPFHAVGCWYENFTQTTDEEVSELLKRAAHLKRMHAIRERHRSINLKAA